MSFSVDVVIRFKLRSHTLSYRVLNYININFEIYIVSRLLAIHFIFNREIKICALFLIYTPFINTKFYDVPRSQK